MKKINFIDVIEDTGGFIIVIMIVNMAIFSVISYNINKLIEYLWLIIPYFILLELFTFIYIKSTYEKSKISMSGMFCIKSFSSMMSFILLGIGYAFFLISKQYPQPTIFFIIVVLITPILLWINTKMFGGKK